MSDHGSQPDAGATPAIPAVPSRRARTPLLARLEIVAAYATTLLVAGQFAKIAIGGVVLVIVATLLEPQLRQLWWAAGALTAAYAVPFTLYLTNPRRAASLSQDMHPVWVVLVVATGVAYVVAYHLLRRSLPGATQPV